MNQFGGFMKFYLSIFIVIIAIFGHNHGKLLSMSEKIQDEIKSNIVTCAVPELITIAKSGNHSGLGYFLRNNPDTDVNATIHNGGTALHIACHEGYSSCVTLLLDHSNISVNQPADDGLTPLLLACRNGHADCVKLLLAHKDIKNNQSTTTNGVTPLFIACQENRADCVKLLLEDNHILVNKAKIKGETPLLIACQKGNLICAKMLLEKGADVNQAIIEDNTTPLFMACQEGHSKCVKLLIENNVDINQAQTDGTTPLFIACQEGHLTCVKLLLENGADINKAQIEDGMTPLAIACQSEQYHCLQLLIEYLVNSKNLSEEDKDLIFRNYYKNYKEYFSLHARELAGYLNKIFATGLKGVMIESSSNENDTCGICQDTFSESLDENPFIVELSCNHIFHETCSRSWAKTGRTNGAHCALCRADNTNKLGRRTIKFLSNSNKKN